MSSRQIARRLGLWQRLVMRWPAATEITELTRDRDRDREERLVAEAAVKLSSSPTAVALLFRSHPHRERTPADHR